MGVRVTGMRNIRNKGVAIHTASVEEQDKILNAVNLANSNNLSARLPAKRHPKVIFFNVSDESFLSSDLAKRCRHLSKVRFSSSTSGDIAGAPITNIPESSGIPPGVMGQPTCHTHPHIVGPGELVAGLTVMDFRNRRTELVKRLVASKMKEGKKGHTILIPSASKMYMSDKIPFIFRQNSDFFYLTGCLEPDSVLMMNCLPGCDNIQQSVLFVRGRDANSELWDGPRTGVDDATRMFRVDVALPYSELSHFLTSHLSAHKSDYFWYSPSSPAHQEVDETIRKAVASVRLSLAPACPRRTIAAQRLIKSSAEAKLMLKAATVAGQAINTAMACTRPGLSEHDIHASIDYWCRRGGAEHLAFPPVVGGGDRATAIHYIHDNQKLKDGELLLVDAGCQHSAYNSDITRTWPVSGKFTPAQATLYDIVHAVQNILLETLLADRPTLDHLFDVMCGALGGFLRAEGIIAKSTSDSAAIALAFKFCPHHVSHYLGLDIHDTPPIQRNVPVQSGMAITVEPGIYIPVHETAVPVEFRGIGIRIEDDVLITNGAHVVLSDVCHRNRNVVEKIVGTRYLPE